MLQKSIIFANTTAKIDLWGSFTVVCPRYFLLIVLQYVKMYNYYLNP